MPKKIGPVNGIHAQRLKQIRKFVNFDYDLRKPLPSAAKKKIKRYHDEITALTNRPYQVYRARNPKNLHKAQQFAQHERKLPGLKVAFVPTDGANRVKLSFNKRGVTAHTKYVTTRHIEFDVSELIEDPEGYVERKLRKIDAGQFTIQAGKYEIPQGYIKSSVPKAVARLTMRYGEASGVDEDNNHHFSRWLHGVFAHTFDKQADLVEYFNVKSKNIKAGKNDRRRAFRAGKRAAIAGKPISANPHTGTLANSWNSGWRAGIRVR
jgi:ribosome modulation factor